MKRVICVGACAVFLGACGDPLANVDRLGDVPLAEEANAPAAAQVQAASEELERRPGLLGLLRRGSDAAAAPNDPVDAAVADVARGAAPAEESASAPSAAASPDASPVVTAAAPEAPEPPRRGLLGRLLGAAPEGKPRETATAEPAEEATLAAAPAPVATPEPQTATRPRGGLFGNRAARINPNAPDKEVISFGVAVPYGEIARVCNVPRGQLGKEIGTYPERRPQYRLYDSKPDQTGLRTFYITGFNDRCARQFTAALALFGDPVLHELLRYGRPSKVQPYSRSDEAYEKVKSRICRVGKGEPCGKRMDKLAQDTVFVSTYERFVGSPSWANILLHGGEVIEKDQLSR